MKLFRLLLIISCLALMSSCSAPAPLPETNADDNISYPETDTNGINGIYIVTPKGAVPIAYTNNGKLSLAGDVYYYNLKNVLDNDDSVKQKPFTLFDADGFNKGETKYDKLPENTQDPYKMLVHSGNWRLCPDIRHIVYDNQSAVPDNYKSLLTELFPDAFKDNQPTVTDAWETDLDCDGTNEAIIKARGENYCALVLLSETIGNSKLCSEFNLKPEYDITPFFADLDGNMTPSLMFLSGSATKTVTVCSEKSATALYTVYLPIV